MFSKPCGLQRNKSNKCACSDCVPFSTGTQVPGSNQLRKPPPERSGLPLVEQKPGAPGAAHTSKKPCVFRHFRSLQAPIWVFDIDNSRVVSANSSACRLWDADSEKELLSRDLSTDMSSTVAERLRQYQKSFLREAVRFDEMWTLYPKGNPVQVKVVFSGFRLAGGRMAMLCEVSRELDEEPETIRAIEALLYTDVMISLYGADGRVLYSNPSARRSLLDAQNPFKTRVNSPCVLKAIASSLARHGEFRGVSEVNTSAGLSWHNISIKQCSDAVTGNAAMLVTERDVTDMKKAQERESYLAFHDPLTGLYNRTYLQKIEGALASRAEGARTFSALLYIDLDRFKQINDSMGHEFGDTVLTTVAQRLRMMVREQDTVFRLGGDEFVVIVSTNSENIQSIAQRICDAIAQPMRINHKEHSITCSIGIARYPADGEQFDTLMRNADLALYAAKKSGRKIHRFFDASMHEEAKKRFELEADIQRALANKEFVLHYQPRVDIVSNLIVGAEGLARWKHPERGLVMPGEFIPLCEETGLIEQLGEQVLMIAAKQQAAWLAAGHKILVSANLSPRQFHSDNLLPLVRSLAQIPGVEPSLLEFEITENVLMGNNEQVMKTLSEIQALGFNIALDDFGTGYSNLAYIPRYPIGCIKIDRSFVEQLPHSAPIIGLILSLGNQIGAKVIAEGVETRKQLNQLKKWKCEEYQGYLFQRPASAEKITLMLEKQAKTLK